MQKTQMALDFSMFFSTRGTNERIFTSDSYLLMPVYAFGFKHDASAHCATPAKAKRET